MRCILCHARNHHHGASLVADDANRRIRFRVAGRRCARNRTGRTALALVAEAQRFGGRLLGNLDASVRSYRTEITVPVLRCWRGGGGGCGGIRLRGVGLCRLHVTVIHFGCLCVCECLSLSGGVMWMRLCRPIGRSRPPRSSLSDRIKCYSESLPQPCNHFVNAG